MAANPDDIQGVARRRFPPLATLRQVRKYAASIIRKMDRDEIPLSRGKSLVWAAMQLHGMIRNEQSPAIGNTTNVLMVANGDTPLARLTERLFGDGESRVIEGGVQEGLMATDGSGAKPGGPDTSLAARPVPGSPAEP